MSVLKKMNVNYLCHFICCMTTIFLYSSHIRLSIISLCKFQLVDIQYAKVVQIETLWNKKLCDFVIKNRYSIIKFISCFVFKIISERKFHWLKSFWSLESDRENNRCVPITLMLTVRRGTIVDVQPTVVYIEL